jgi:tetratricopeptide (TPR) repeat protein
MSYADRIGHPLLTGMAGTTRGFVALDSGDIEGAARDAQAVMTKVEPNNPLAPAQVGPRVLLARARLAEGDAATAIGLLAPIATAAKGPGLLFSRRQALAVYAAALLAEGQQIQALDWARRAMAVPAEDVRSCVVAAEVLAESLAAGGQREEALMAADEAVRHAYETQRVAERAGADAVRERLGRVSSVPSNP